MPSLKKPRYGLLFNRPFCTEHIFFDRILNEEVYQVPHLFPTKASREENRAICVTAIGNTKPFHCVMTDAIPDLHLTGESQCFPFYTYDEDGSNRRENITDWALAEFQRRYTPASAQGKGLQPLVGKRTGRAKDKGLKPLAGTISKGDIFYYVYGVLHHPGYREKYADNLKRELPRIPYAVDF